MKSDTLRRPISRLISILPYGPYESASCFNKTMQILNGKVLESPITADCVYYLRSRSYDCFDWESKHLVFSQTPLGYKGLNIDPFKRIANPLRKNNFPKYIFCTLQNTVFMYRYSAVATSEDFIGPGQTQKYHLISRG